MTSCSSALSKRSSTSFFLEDTSPSHQVAAQREFLFDNLHRFLAYHSTSYNQYKLFSTCLQIFSVFSFFLFFSPVLLLFSSSFFRFLFKVFFPTVDALSRLLHFLSFLVDALPRLLHSFHAFLFILLPCFYSFFFLCLWPFLSDLFLSSVSAPLFHSVFHSVHSVAFSFTSSCIGKWVRNYFAFIPLILGFLRCIKALVSGGGTFDHRFTVISPQENFWDVTHTILNANFHQVNHWQSILVASYLLTTRLLHSPGTAMWWRCVVFVLTLLLYLDLCIQFFGTVSPSCQLTEGQPLGQRRCWAMQQPAKKIGLCRFSLMPFFLH